MTLLATLCRVSCLCWALLSAEQAFGAGWTDALQQQVERIDRESPGHLGVYVKRLDTGETLSYQADRRWYLASSAKLPIAIALLQEVEAGRIGLDQRLVLQATDKVDGSGDVVWQKNGATFTVDALLKRMLMVSDNTAANMLYRTIGADRLNQRVQALLGAGDPKDVTPFTDFTQIRRDVYAELHPGASRIANLDLVKIAGAPMGPKRVDAVRRVLSVPEGELRVRTMEEAYERYYARQLNSATLAAYGAMLEKFVRGELLSPPHMALLFTHLKYDTYDAYRLEKGLPRTVRFIHKTGTQLQRACHMGVIDPQDKGRQAIVVATCAEGLDEHKEAGQVFEAVGRAITRTLLAGR